MGYQVKWIIDNLGISRKALRVFEDHDLLPKPNGKTRDFSEEDIEWIWFIRVLQGIGFSLNEIEEFRDNEDFDMQERIKIKISELEKEKERLEQHIGYARYIKLTGRYPTRPKEMGSVTFDEFQKKSLEGWNINEEPAMKDYQDFIDDYLSMPEEDFMKTNFGQVIKLFESLDLSPQGVNKKMFSCYLPLAIGRRIELGSKHPEVQLLVKMLYEELKAYEPCLEKMDEYLFARLHASLYVEGDEAKMKIKQFGKEQCDFIADAIAVFGGFEDYNSIP